LHTALRARADRTRSRSYAVSRKTSIAFLVFAAAALPAPAAAEPVARVALGPGQNVLANRACADADLEPTATSLERVRAAILCLHNQVRARHRLPALRENARLRAAALGHSRNMVSDRFFEHTAPSGATMVDRILRTRYVGPNEGWALGENLAWGTGSLATARGAVDAWMDSPGHRANILRRTYREVGVGIVLGVPVSDADGATYTVDFGVRR
jgi:uncharacterized protein YkwD